LNREPGLVYTARMPLSARTSRKQPIAVTPSRRTLHAELLRLCARIGYSPPVSR
jgi:hypothetical protein